MSFGSPALTSFVKLLDQLLETAACAEVIRPHFPQLLTRPLASICPWLRARDHTTFDLVNAASEAALMLALWKELEFRVLCGILKRSFSRNPYRRSAAVATQYLAVSKS